MPLYEYHCDHCDTTVEFVRKMQDRDEDLPICAGDIILDTSGDAKIENGEPHDFTYMQPKVSRLGATFLRGPRFAGGR